MKITYSQFRTSWGDRYLAVPLVLQILHANYLKTPVIFVLTQSTNDIMCLQGLHSIPHINDKGKC